MQLLEVVYPAKTGILKMTNCILFVCGALKLNAEETSQVKEYVEEKLEDLYIEFKNKLA